MRITFPNEEEAIYSMYVDNGNGQIKELTTVAAAAYVFKQLLKVTPAGRRLLLDFK